MFASSFREDDDATTVQTRSCRWNCSYGVYESHHSCEREYLSFRLGRLIVLGFSCHNSVEIDGIHNSAGPPCWLHKARAVLLLRTPKLDPFRGALFRVGTCMSRCIRRWKRKDVRFQGCLVSMILCSSEGWLLLRGWLLLQKKCLANTVEEGKKAASSYSPICCSAAEGVLFTDAMG